MIIYIIEHFLITLVPSGVKTKLMTSELLVQKFLMTS